MSRAVKSRKILRMIPQGSSLSNMVNGGSIYQAIDWRTGSGEGRRRGVAQMTKQSGEGMELSLRRARDRETAQKHRSFLNVK